MEQGAVPSAYQGDPKQTTDLLNAALATEIVCVLRYRHHYFMASGMHGESIAQTFQKYSQEEQGHADHPPPEAPPAMPVFTRLAAIAAVPAAQAMFDVLTQANRFALIYRINAVKRAETRERKIREFVAMLARTLGLQLGTGNTPFTDVPP